MYQALYRKWRPKAFDDVVGQEHITETLKRQVESGRLSHAYLFVGTRGTGKTTCAKILAKAANCENPIGGDPCNKCPSCVGIDSGAILDIEELDAASNNSVDNIRALREEAIYTPATVRKRVYIVDEVHMLSTAAFNALLKTLEEPPEHLIFILATTELHKVPATILSRCQRFTFKRIPSEKIALRLGYVAERENIDLTADGAELLSVMADGSMRDSLSLLDQCAWEGTVDAKRVRDVLGLAGNEATERLLRSCISGDTASAIKIIGDMYFGGKEVGSVLNELMGLCRDVLVVKLTGGEAGGLTSGQYGSDTLKALAKLMPASDYLRYVKIIQQSIGEMTLSSNRRITAEMCAAELSSPKLNNDLGALSSRISRLEEAIENGSFVRSEAPVYREEAPVSAPSAPKNIPDVPWEVTSEDKGYKEKPKKVKEPPVIASYEERPPYDDMDAPPIAEEIKTASAPMPAGGGDDAWKQILGMIENKIDIPPYSFLSDRSHCVPKIKDAALEIQTKNPIAGNIINVTPVTNALKQAADKVLGRPVKIVVCDYKEESAPEEDKLDKLRKFSNIKFE